MLFSTKKLSFILPFFKELDNFTSSFDGEIPLKQESIDNLWMACSVSQQLILGRMLHQNSDNRQRVSLGICLPPYYTFQDAVTYILFAFFSTWSHCFLHAIFYRQDSCHSPQGVHFFSSVNSYNQSAAVTCLYVRLQGLVVFSGALRSRLCAKELIIPSLTPPDLRFWHHSPFVKCYQSAGILMLLSEASPALE